MKDEFTKKQPGSLKKPTESVTEPVLVDFPFCSELEQERHVIPEGETVILGPAEIGPREQELKALYIPIFWKEARIKTAYLAKVRFPDDSEIKFALCLRNVSGAYDLQLVKYLLGIFAPLYYSHEYLNICFIGDEDEARVAAVCPPFFERKLPQLEVVN